jgi:hypothetical protein
MKKLLMLGVILAMVLTLILPSAAMAAKPASFYASGAIFGITPGTVDAAGNSGNWRVMEREITGTLFNMNDLPVRDNFSLTYKGVFELATQQGNFRGLMTSDEKSFNVNGKVAPLESVLVNLPGYGLVNLPKLTISGNWNYADGDKGNGVFEAWLIFIPDGGHVGSVVASSFVMKSK